MALLEKGTNGICNRDEIDKLVDRAYKRIQAYFDFYRITDKDFPFFEKESPKLFETIRAIEDTPRLKLEEMQVMCTKWVENYHSLFKRRAYFRK